MVNINLGIMKVILFMIGWLTLEESPILVEFIIMDANQTEKPVLVTWQDRAKTTSHLVAHAAILGALTYFTGTIYSVCFSALATYGGFYAVNKRDERRLKTFVAANHHILRSESQEFKREHHTLSAMVSKLSLRANLKMTPHVILMREGEAEDNIGVSDHPFTVVAYKTYTDQLTKKQLFVDVGHELAHLAFKHHKIDKIAELLMAAAAWEALGNVVASVISLDLSSIVSSVVICGAFNLSNALIHRSQYMVTERQADKGALLLCKDPETQISGLQKGEEAFFSAPQPKRWGTNWAEKVEEIAVRAFTRSRVRNVRKAAKQYGIV